jgi:hypothetical protein
VVTSSVSSDRTQRALTQQRLGDSLTQGFKSLAITDTGLSWPAIVAWELRLSAQQFTFPRYPGPAVCPGLPEPTRAARPTTTHSINHRNSALVKCPGR